MSEVKASRKQPVDEYIDKLTSVIFVYKAHH